MNRIADSDSALIPHSSANPSRLTRDDIATVTSVYRRETSRFNVSATFGLLGGLLSAVVLMAIADGLGWTAGDPFFLLGGWGLGLTGMALASRRRQRALAEINLHCGTCSAPLIESTSFFRPDSEKRSLARAELIVATGGCPTCGNDFIAERGILE